MHAAWLVCRELGLNPEQFTGAISTFTGAAKRLELLAQNGQTIVYRDFAHAPSKVGATLQAVRAQFSNKKLIGLLELHTYSSLNKDFMEQYKGVMDGADEAAVFYSKHALEIKRLPHLDKEVVQEGFGNKALHIFNTREELQSWLDGLDYSNSVVLLMSLGNYDGMDVEAFAKTITQSVVG